MSAPAAPALATLLAAFASAPAAAQTTGTWDPPFDHEVNTANTNVLVIPPTHVWPPHFNAIHMALIPVGPYRGHVLVWDKSEVAVRPYQRWSIIDPDWTPGSSTPRFRNFFLAMPTGATIGDLFCAAHTWLRDGRLFVAGGTAMYPVPPNFYLGAATVYQFAPDLFDVNNGDFGVWKRETDLAATRWYPGAVVLADDAVLISGGSDNSIQQNSYEVYRMGGPWGADPPSNLVPDQRATGGGTLRVYSGASWPGGFSDYPRIQVLTTGQTFCSGWNRPGFKWTHTPATNPVYDFSAGTSVDPASLPYSSCLLDPRPGSPSDRVLRIAGILNGTPRAGVDWVDAGAPGPWTTYAAPFSLNRPRWFLNAVGLPNGEVFVFGGFSDGNNPGTPELTGELLTSAGWVLQPQHTGARGYHATSVLLPDGRVFVGGADTRTVDYQIYNPPYLTNGNPRPQDVGCDVAGQIGGIRYTDDDPTRVYTAWWDENLPANVTIARVVLAMPGSVTHHSDLGQRQVRLEIVRDDDVPASECRIRFRGPKNSRHAPRGWYMLFLVTNQGVPSKAVWVHVQ